MAIDTVVQHAAGLDIAKASLVACIRIPNVEAGWLTRRREFTTITARPAGTGIDWLGDHGHHPVTMESAADYGTPAFSNVPEAPLRLPVAPKSPRHNELVPGRQDRTWPIRRGSLTWSHTAWCVPVSCARPRSGGCAT